MITPITIPIVGSREYIKWIPFIVASDCWTLGTKWYSFSSIKPAITAPIAWENFVAKVCTEKDTPSARFPET